MEDLFEQLEFCTDLGSDLVIKFHKGYTFDSDEWQIYDGVTKISGYSFRDVAEKFLERKSLSGE